MQEKAVIYTFHAPGTMSADLDIRFKLPFGATLIHVSAVGSNSNDATIKVGTSSDDDAAMTAKSFGDSGTPAEYDEDDFVGSEFYHFDDGDTVVVTIDYDGNSGTAVDDPTVVLTFLTG